jgi:uncharacterized protein YdaT
MGNQPSAPSQPNAPTPPPPVIPVCDMDCQRQKQLSLLKSALDQATATQDSNPEGYEEARIAYYTTLNGQSWLVQEKTDIAKNEIEPLLKNYSTKLDSLKEEIQSQKIFADLAGALKKQESSDEQDNAFLSKQVNAEKDQVALLNRMNELGAPAPIPVLVPVTPPWYQVFIWWIVGAVITVFILGWFWIYIRVILSWFKPSSNLSVIT